PPGSRWSRRWRPSGRGRSPVDDLEAAKFLTVSAALTGREPSREQAEAWAIILDDIPLADALAALKAHYRASRFPVMPADIVEQVEAARVAAVKAEQRAVSLARQRNANAAHRRQVLADHGS